MLLTLFSGQYFLSVIILLVLTTGTTVMVLYVHFHGALKVILPNLAKKIILVWLATLVFMKDKVDRVLDPKNRIKLGLQGWSEPATGATFHNV